MSNDRANIRGRDRSANAAFRVERKKQKQRLGRVVISGVKVIEGGYN